MADKIELKADVRSAVGRGINALRRAGQVPAVVYGHGIQPVSIQVDAREVGNTLRKIGRNTLISLMVNGGTKMVLTREIQRDPVRRNILHIDFYEVNMSEKVTANVRVLTVGESADVKSGAGVLLQERDTLEIEALPGDLIESVTIDVSNMKIDDVVRVKDIVVPAGIRFLEEPEEDVVRMTRFVEAKVEEGAAETAEVEVIEKGKKDEEGEE
jgi:large subunit ribosomal protein L25